MKKCVSVTLVASGLAACSAAAVAVSGHAWTAHLPVVILAPALPEGEAMMMLGVLGAHFGGEAAKVV